MNARRYSIFLAGLGTSLILFSLFISPAMAAFTPSTGQVKAANTAQMLQFTSGRYALGFAADGMYAATDTHALHVDFEGANSVQLQNGATLIASLASDGTKGNYDSLWASISADGRYIAFHSFADNLASNDTNGYADIFVHNFITGETTLISVSSDLEQGNAGSFCPSISADGRFVAFVSLASNLVIGDTNSSYDVFVRDRQTGYTERVSVSSNGEQGNSDSGYHNLNPGYVPGYCGEPNKVSISSDGRYVAFNSMANNLIQNDSNGYGDVFVHDRVTHETILISSSYNGSQGNDWSWGPSISENGRYVAFFPGQAIWYRGIIITQGIFLFEIYKQVKQSEPLFRRLELRGMVNHWLRQYRQMGVT